MQDQIGLHPKIIRKTQGNPCPWCANLAGVYDYPCDSVVFKRHANCSCIIDYDPGDGKRIQNAFTKRWTGTKKIDRIGARKKSGADATAFLNDLAEHPAKLGAYTPETLKKELEDKGCAVTPLSSGNYKDISFENGGGYKTNFGGDGLLMYHPKKRSHHGGAYYKISTGKKGIKHYDLTGNELKPTEDI